MEKVSINDILAIRAGQSKTFILPDVKACHSARATAYYVNSTHPRANVSAYSCYINKENRSITIVANKKNENII